MKQARNIIIVLASGILFAFLIVGATLYFYSPSGRYIAKNVILDPTLNFRVELSGIEVSKARYARFYALIAKSRSLTTAPTGLYSITLSFIVNSKPFIDMQFDGDYFRVELREEGRFAYFYHPNIAEEAKRLVAP